MATLAQLEEAFVKADEAGNFEDAKAFADEIKRLRAEQQALESLETGLKEERKQTRRERIKNIADIPISLAKGTALGTVGLASIPSMIQQGQEYLFSKVPYGEQAQQIMSATPFAKPLSTPSMEQLMGLLESIPGVKYLTRYDPKTLVGEYAQTAGEFIGPSAIAAGVKKSPQMLKTAGILGGIGA